MAHSMEVDTGMAVGLLMVRRRSFLLIDPLRPVSGVDDVDEVNAARPSVLYAVAGPWGSSVAPFELAVVRSLIFISSGHYFDG